MVLIPRPWLLPLVAATIHLGVSPAAARSSAHRFIALGAEAEAPRGFVEMCGRDARFCSDTPAAGDPAIVTAALRTTTRRPTVDHDDPRAATAGATALLRQVNRRVNAAVAQRSDDALYGVAELWRRSGMGPLAAGDCEDIAIEKRIRLIEAGYPADRLSFAVVYSRDAGLHTILLARTDRGDLVLDSRRDRVIAWSKTRYRWLSVQTTGDPMLWRAIAAA